MGKVYNNMIVLEGMDCTGKSTTCELLKKKLDDVIIIKFPNYSNPSSNQLIKTFLNGDIKFCNIEFDKMKTISTIFILDRYNSLNVKMNRSDNPDIDTILNNRQREMSIIDIMDEYPDKLFVFDRYIQSNIIHQSLTLPDDDVFEFGSWLIDTELNHNKLPIPNASFYIIPDNINVIKNRIANRKDKSIDILEEEDNLIKTFQNINRQPVQELLMGKFPSTTHNIYINSHTTPDELVDEVIRRL